MKTTKPIGLASDHGGFLLKQYVKSYLDTNGIIYKDYGCYTSESCDYPDYGHALARAIEGGECTVGIGLCGTGEGIGMTLNKHQRIRAAICWAPEIARLARAHNDANVLILPGRFMDENTAREVLDVFFNTPFDGGRHERRIKKIPLTLPEKL